MQKLGIIFLLLFFPIVLFANNLTTNQRAFLAALADLQKGKQQEFLQITEHLRNYPLYPYLIYADLAVHLNEATPQQLQGFLTAYSNTPLSLQLRELWLAQLANKEDWKTYLQVYEPSKDLNLACDQRKAYWVTGQYANAMNGFSDLLGKTSSVPKACLWVFGQAVSSGNIAQHLLWDRIQIAFQNNNPDLATQLANFLPLNQRNSFFYWKQTYLNPMLILNPKLFQYTGENSENVLLTAIQRLSNKNSRLAADVWARVQKQNNFDSDIQVKVTKLIALNLAQDHDASAQNWLMAIPENAVDKNIQEWRIRNALWQQNWPMVKISIDLLPPAEKQSTQWRYWMARALNAQGQTDTARNIYHDLSMHGDFYGQLASLQLNQQPLMTLETLKVNPQQITAIASLSSMQRAYELYQLHWLPEANQEWEWGIKHMPEEDYLASAELAIQWGWFERAINTVNLINDGVNIPLKFPLAYREPIIGSAIRNQMNPAWIFALIRQESLFTPYAKSSAGAVGLMQLMPTTASLVARQSHVGFSMADLTDPGTNLLLGSIYLRKMLSGFNGNQVLATAAYNAGPNRVKKWIPQNAMPADIWIENIPYHETRDYVKNIMTSTSFYEKELGIPSTLSQRVSPL